MTINRLEALIAAVLTAATVASGGGKVAVVVDGVGADEREINAKAGEHPGSPVVDDAEGVRPHPPANHDDRHARVAGKELGGVDGSGDDGEFAVCGKVRGEEGREEALVDEDGPGAGQVANRLPDDPILLLGELLLTAGEGGLEDPRLHRADHPVVAGHPAALLEIAQVAAQGFDGGVRTSGQVRDGEAAFAADDLEQFVAAMGRGKLVAGTAACRGGW